MITIRYYIYISLVFGIFRLLLCMFNALFLVVIFIISLHISSHHLTVIYVYWDFLGSFSGSNTVALMFYLCFPYFFLVFCVSYFCFFFCYFTICFCYYMTIYINM